MPAGFNALRPKLKPALITQNLIVPTLFCFWGFPCCTGWMGLCFRLTCCGFFLGNMLGGFALQDEGHQMIAFRAGLTSNSVASWIVSLGWCYGFAAWVVLMVLEHMFMFVATKVLCGRRVAAPLLFTASGSVLGYIVKCFAHEDDSDVDKSEAAGWVRKAAATVFCLVSGMTAVFLFNVSDLKRKLQVIWALIEALFAEDDSADADGASSHIIEEINKVVVGSKETQAPSTTSETTHGISTTLSEASVRLGLEMKRVVGKGSFGKVYYATDSEGNGRAVKQVDWVGNETKTKYLPENEAKLMSACIHPCIVGVLECLTLDASGGMETWIVQEWCDGGSLHSFCSAPRSTKETAELSVDICAGGGYLHKKGIIHSDLTANNVLICTKESHGPTAKGFRCRICDFGLARLIERDLDCVLTSSLGTVSHMPPEVLLQEHRLTPKTDVYSFGVLLHHMVSGKVPYAGHTALQIILAVSNGKQLDPPECTEELKSIYLRCASVDYGSRPSFDELESEFANLLS